MSKIYKSANIVIDKNNRVNIIVEKIPEPSVPEPETIDNAEETAQSIIEKAKAKETSIIQKAEKKAAEIVEKAKQRAVAEADEIRRLAEEAGYSEGYGIGEKEAEGLKAEARKIKADAEKYKEDLIRGTEPEMVEFILGLINKIISDEMEYNRDLILLLIRKGLKQSTVTGDICVHVSRDDFGHVTKNREVILQNLETMAKISFLEDLGMKPAECIIETSFGSIHCNLDEQFRELSKSMRFILSAHS